MTHLHLIWIALVMTSAKSNSFVEIPAGEFNSSLRYETTNSMARVGGFAMQSKLVTVGEFESFLKAVPRWQRNRVPSLLADKGYLAGWQGDDNAGDKLDANSPVTSVSWFAADAYCVRLGARLPDWLEWEYVAAADHERPDARLDPAWIVRTMHDGTRHAMDARRDARPNVHGLLELHGSTWEWVGDFSALLSGTDARGTNNGDALQFCGSAGVAYANPKDYSVVKRVTMMSSITPRSTLTNLGFRCAKDSNVK